ncbi:hypothetical protein [Thermosulfuriphilus sp.]
MSREGVSWEKSWPRPVDPQEKHRVFGYFEIRFGIPGEVFSPYLLLATAKNYWLLRDTGRLEDIKHLKIQTAGLLFARQVSRYLKPTTVALQRFGHLAERSVVALKPSELKALREKREINLEVEVEPGYVILRCGEDIWGCGLYLPPRLISHLPGSP